MHEAPARVLRVSEQDSGLAGDASVAPETRALGASTHEAPACAVSSIEGKVLAVLEALAWLGEQVIGTDRQGM